MNELKNELGSFFVLCNSVDFAKWIISCIHYYCITQNTFTALNIPCALPMYPSFPSPETTDLIFFTVSIDLLFPECHIIEMNYMKIWAPR